MTTMMGDWNFASDLHGSDMLGSRAAPHHSRSLASWRMAHASEALEIVGVEPTRRQIRDGSMAHSATLERAHCIAHELDLCLRPELSHPFSVVDLRVLSDHGPTLLHFGRGHGFQVRIRVPDHISKRDDLGPRMWELFDAVRDRGASRFDALLHLKSCVHLVTMHIARELWCVPHARPPASLLLACAFGGHGYSRRRTVILDDAEAMEASRSHWEPVLTQTSHDIDAVAQLSTLR